MRKLLVVLSFGFLMAGVSEAANPTRGAKGVSAQNYTVQGTTVSTTAGVLYSIVLSSGAPGTDFAVVFDSASAVGLTASNTGSTMRTRCMASSATANTFCQYDPPLQFNNGIVVYNSGSGIQSLVTYERGRVTQGY